MARVLLRKSNEVKPPVVGVRHDNDVGSSVDPADTVFGDADVLALVVHLGFLLVSKINHNLCPRTKRGKSKTCDLYPQVLTPIGDSHPA